MNLSELRQYILLIAGRLAKWSIVDRLTSEFGGLFATMPAATDSPGQSTTQPARNMVGFGFRSAPVAGSECIVVAPRGGAVNAAVVATDHLGYGPTDLAEGDAVVYSKAHTQSDVCATKHAATGKITVDSKAGQDVQVNGGTLKVARLTDDVSSGAITINVTGVAPAAQTVTILYTDQSGATFPLLVFTVTLGLVAIVNPLTTMMNPSLTLTAPVSGEITGPGADRFKA